MLDSEWSWRNMAQVRNRNIAELSCRVTNDGVFEPLRSLVVEFGDG